MLTLAFLSLSAGVSVQTDLSPDLSSALLLNVLGPNPKFFSSGGSSVIHDSRVSCLGSSFTKERGKKSEKKKQTNQQNQIGKTHCLNLSASSRNQQLLFALTLSITNTTVTGLMQTQAGKEKHKTLQQQNIMSEKPQLTLSAEVSFSFIL